MRTSLSAIIVFAALAAGSGLVLSAVPANRATQPAAQPSANPIPLRPLQNRFCNGQAPQGWIIADQDPNGASFTLASSDRRIIAAYGIVGVTSGHAAGFYGPQFTNPSAFAQFLASTATGEELIQAGAPKPLGAMRVLALQGGGTRGYVIYRTYPLPADPGGYVLSVRIGAGTSEAEERIAGAVAATISCTTALRPPSGGYAQIEARHGGVGISQACKSGECDESDLAGTYNAQLGTGYVHSDSGENYLVDVTRDYRENGPDGPGYYRQVGSALERLEPGRAD